MNRKAFVACVFSAVLLGAGIAAHGWFLGQQGVNFLQAQEQAFLRAMQNGAVPLDRED